MSRRRRLPTPAMLVAICALIVGLTGSAVALQGKNSVKSDDIAPSAVKAADIHKLAVQPPSLNLFKTKGLVGPLSTASKTPVELGGPSVKVKVPQGGLVAVYARVTGQVNGGGNNASAQVHLFEPTVLPNSPTIMQFNNPDPQIRFTVPGQPDAGGTGGVANPARGGFLVFSPVNPGTYRFSLRYSNPGAGAATFTNAGLWAGVVQ
jgi:hypothetical protein